MQGSSEEEELEYAEEVGEDADSTPGIVPTYVHQSK
jgi:hypothetical protein